MEEKADRWVAACGGKEVPCIHGGIEYLYVYNHATNEAMSKDEKIIREAKTMFPNKSLKLAVFLYVAKMSGKSLQYGRKEYALSEARERERKGEPRPYWIPRNAPPFKYGGPEETTFLG